VTGEKIDDPISDAARQGKANGQLRSDFFLLDLNDAHGQLTTSPSNFAASK
jgi:hypothetical protein